MIVRACKLDLSMTTNAVSRPLSAPVVSSAGMADSTSDRTKETSIINTDATVGLKKNRNGEDKGIWNRRNMYENRRRNNEIKWTFSLIENEKENDSRGGQATQAIIQRRRRPKRRSTGVCNVGGEVKN